MVAGHTDAAGGEDYNQNLSERRAESIKKYLVDKYGINGTDLVTVGYGKSKLKDPNQPMAEANRRVQVVNMENKTTPHPSNAGVNGVALPEVFRLKCVPHTLRDAFFLGPLLLFGPLTCASHFSTLHLD